MHLRLHILIFILFSVCSWVNCQFSVNKYPVRFSQYYNSYLNVNPASVGSYSSIEAALGSQQLLGNFSKVSTSYVNLGMRINKTRRLNSPFSAIGLRFYNDREGKYLNRSRIYLIYAWHAHLSNKLMFSGGLEIGGMNYSVKGSDLTYGGSDFKPDGSVGLRFYNEKFHVGVSMQQIFNSQIQPLEEIAILSSFLNFSGAYKYIAGENLVINPSLFYRFQLDDSKSFVDINLNVDIIEKLFISVGIHNNSMFANSIGVQNLKTSVGLFGIHFSYIYPFRKEALNTNIAEISLFFKSNK